ncbi:MAG: helix-turn-helix domain-containing protein [Chloroflexi bacterium]|nr:MAG: helix-turn-helix domain-containing protein [Chloroflexota bacterium]
MTVREVAAYLRVSTKTVYGLCARGELRQHPRAQCHQDSSIGPRSVCFLRSS